MTPFITECDNSTPMSEKPKGRGFLSMTPEKRREIAKLGGKAAHKNGRAHQFTSEEARAAGHKGGKATSANREHMAMIGRKGGSMRGRAKEVAAEERVTESITP